jgi:outer membrane protein
VLQKKLPQGDVMKNSSRALIVCTAVLAAAAGASAQGAQPAAASAGAPTRVAVIDFRTAIGSTAEGRQATAELQSQFSPRSAELDGIRKSMQDLQNRASAGERTMSDEERARLERQYQRMQQQLQRKQEEFQQDVNEAQQEAFNRLGVKMQEVVTRYARENSISVVVDPTQAGVIYYANQLDVTQDVIRLYDQANPVKASATAPGATKPPAGTAAPRPAATQPATNPPPAKPKP